MDFCDVLQCKYWQWHSLPLLHHLLQRLHDGHHCFPISMSVANDKISKYLSVQATFAINHSHQYQVADSFEEDDAAASALQEHFSVIVVGVGIADTLG